MLQEKTSSLLPLPCFILKNIFKYLQYLTFAYYKALSGSHAKALPGISI